MTNWDRKVHIHVENGVLKNSAISKYIYVLKEPREVAQGLNERFLNLLSFKKIRLTLKGRCNLGVLFLNRWPLTAILSNLSRVLC